MSDHTPDISGTATPEDKERWAPSVPQEGDAPDPNVITWNGPDDPGHPHNWPFFRKIYITAVLALVTLIPTIGSSIFSSGSTEIEETFHIGQEATVLGTSLFLIGFTVGPLAWGPMSERFGRRVPMLIGLFVFSVFCIPVAVAQNIETIMLGRFLSGAFGAAPIAIVAGALTDLWNTVDRGVALAFFVGSVLSGPLIGPIIGDFIAQSYLGWRWTMYITMILGFSVSLVGVIVIPETYAPLILSKKARQIRFETKNWAVRTKRDEEPAQLKEFVQVYLLRPYVLFATEPILIFVTLYQSFLYGVLYLFFESFPISFRLSRHWKLGLSSLPFLALMVGVYSGAAFAIYTTLTWYARVTKEHGGQPPLEKRLPLMMVGAVLLPIGLFWFAWTSNPHIPWPAEVLASVPIGAGIFLVFIQCFNYLIDVYLHITNSALAVNMVVRSCFGAGFPLFASAMYDTLGIDWATSLLGFISIAMIPVPVGFYFYGQRIRAWSKNSQNKS